ncbi:MAG: hypothetical protein K0R18_1071 [Bacillales bacterium]|jgi:SagB-type dehydrogenase family enzyme|nr:hypothetical protein [Bacillales bacterium]
MKLDERYFIRESDNYDLLTNNLRKKAANFPGWLMYLAPRIKYTIDFEKKENFKHCITKDFWDIQLDESILNFSLANSLINRKTTPLEGLTTSWSEKEILSLLNLALSNGKRHKIYRNQYMPLRNYPSGGAQYPMKLYLAMNCDAGFFKKNKAYEIHPDVGLISLSRREDSEVNFEDIFAVSHFNKSLYLTVNKIPFSIIFVMNLKNSFEKYRYLSENLALLEAGHIAQNLQLVSVALKKHSQPCGGVIADIAKHFIGRQNMDDDFVVYGVLFG